MEFKIMVNEIRAFKIIACDFRANERETVCSCEIILLMERLNQF